TAGGSTRQITFERHPDHAVGVPVWSPAGNRIAFLASRSGVSHLCLVNADGSGLRHGIAQGFYACWSGDGQWLYYSPPHQPTMIQKVPVGGGTPVPVRKDNAAAPAVASDGSTLYYASQSKPEVGDQSDWEIRKASPEN